MPIKTTKGVPLSAWVGDTLKFTLPVGDYDPSVDACKIQFQLESGGGYHEETGVDNSDGTWLFTVDELTEAGVYRWQRYIEDASGDKQTVGYGVLRLRAAPSVSGDDLRSDVKITLDALTATLKGKATQDQLSYSINNRSVSRMSPTELREWRDHYKTLYDEELAADAIEAGETPGIYYAEFH